MTDKPRVWAWKFGQVRKNGRFSSERCVKKWICEAPSIPAAGKGSTPGEAYRDMLETIRRSQSDDWWRTSR